MRLRTALSGIVERVDGSVADPMLYRDLVHGLYSGSGAPKAILSATLVASIMTAAAGVISADHLYFIVMCGFVVVGVARSFSVWLYRGAVPDPHDRASIARWELGALAGAWAFASLVGFAGAYSVMAHSDSQVELLITFCVMGYIAGAASRNASRPFITIGQISCTCLPFLVALTANGDFVHAVLAGFVGVLYAATILLCRGAFENIVARHEAFRKIETLAQRDSLTGLWNRSAFLTKLETHFPTTGKMHGEIALIAIDLDRFKDINDTLGHPVGDSVLQQVAARIQSVLRRGDEVSRIGGDEFLVMLTGRHVRNVQSVSTRILDVLSEPIEVNMTRSVCGGSIGYAIGPRDGTTLESLMRNADLALYEAKRRGRAQVVPYSATLSYNYDNRVALEHDLQFALDRNEFHLVYQPIVDPRSCRTICCEALLRWKHATLGPIGPDVFIPIAETTGAISRIGAWVLTTACSEATHWPSDIKVAVNLSAVQFRRGREIVDTVMNALSDTGLAPQRLDLEITESVLIDDSASALKILDELRSKGVGVSLDDFGTGFASLAYLNDFPFSKIKIDRKFSQNIDGSVRTAAIVKGIVQTTRELRMERVAEGVETLAQLERMQSYGVNAIQGYLFSRPVPAADLRDLIRAPIRPVVQPERKVAS